MNAALRAERAIRSEPRFNAEEAQQGAADRRPKTDVLRALRQAQRNYLGPVQPRTLIEEELVALTPSEIAGLLNIADQRRAQVANRSSGGLLAILESRGQAPKRQTALPAEPRAAYGDLTQMGEIYRNPAY